jgi:Tir chaperone protein (CesT) family
MALKQFVEQLTNDLSLEQALEAKEDGSYSLRLEPDLDVVLRENNEKNIQIQAILADLPQVQTEEFMLRMVTANLLGRETGGSALGLDAEGKKVILIDFLSEHEPYRAFYEKLEEFLNYAEAWRRETVEFQRLAND